METKQHIFGQPMSKRRNQKGNLKNSKQMKMQTQYTKPTGWYKSSSERKSNEYIYFEIRKISNNLNLHFEKEE